MASPDVAERERGRSVSTATKRSVFGRDDRSGVVVERLGGRCGSAPLSKLGEVDEVVGEYAMSAPIACAGVAAQPGASGPVALEM